MKNKRKINRKYENNGDTNEIKKIIKIAIGVILFFGIVYIIAALLTGEIKFKDEKKEETAIQYTEILAESTFKQNEREYYVVYYDFSGNEAVLIDAIATDLAEKGTLYKVDLSNGFNKNFISENGKPKTKPKNANELTVVNPTLIKVKNKKVEKFLTGAKNIKEYVVKIK